MTENPMVAVFRPTETDDQAYFICVCRWRDFGILFNPFNHYTHFEVTNEWLQWHGLTERSDIK